MTLYPSFRKVAQSLLGICLLFVLSSFQLKGQEVQYPDITLTYTKLGDGSKKLMTNLSLFINRKVIPLVNEYVRFYSGYEELVEVGSLYTDDKGNAEIIIPAGVDVPMNNELFSRYLVKYAGHDSIGEAETEVEFRDMMLEMSLADIDSVHTISLKATQIDKNGKIIPVAEQDVYICVPRMFSLLTVAEEWIDAEGNATIEFPTNIPGDSLGNITIVAMLRDNEVYGNVEARQTISWGVMPDYSHLVSYRALWTQIAPTWMIITLTILLVGVWSHYFFVIIQLIRVKLLSKKPD